MLDINPTKYLGMESHIKDMRLLTVMGLGVALDEMHVRIQGLSQKLTAEVDPIERAHLTSQMIALHEMMAWCAEEMKGATVGSPASIR
jgi:hypothetical protein